MFGNFKSYVRSGESTRLGRIEQMVMDMRVHNEELHDRIGKMQMRSDECKLEKSVRDTQIRMDQLECEHGEFTYSGVSATSIVEKRCSHCNKHISDVHASQVAQAKIADAEALLEGLRGRPPSGVETPGDLFKSGCQVANDDIKRTLLNLGFDLTKNQMHDVMQTIIFHIRVEYE